MYRNEPSAIAAILFLDNFVWQKEDMRRTLHVVLTLFCGYCPYSHAWGPFDLGQTPISSPAPEDGKGSLPNKAAPTCIDLSGTWKMKCTLAGKVVKEGVEHYQQDGCRSLATPDFKVEINNMMTMTRTVSRAGGFVFETVTHLATWNDNGNELRQVERGISRPVTHDPFEAVKETTVEAVEEIRKDGDKLVNTIKVSNLPEPIICEATRAEVR